MKTIKIYVGTYAKYNDGSIAGEWLEVTSDYDLLMEQILELHSDEDDPEIMIQDYDIEDEGLQTIFKDLGETPDLEEVCKAIELLENEDTDMIAAYINCMGAGDSIEDTIKAANDAFMGEYDSDEDFAENMAEETGAIDKNLSWPYTCINWEFAARELMYDYSTSNNYYFTNY